MEDRIMLFNYMEFLEELRTNNDPKKRWLIEQWHKFSSAKSLEEEPFYDYLKKFNVKNISYKLPADFSNDFDWQLLFQLIAASFACEYELIYPNIDESDDEISKNKLPELNISVNYLNISRSAVVSELDPSQIKKLYDIYLSEQIKFYIIKIEDDEENSTTDMAQDNCLIIFKKQKEMFLKRKNDFEHKSMRRKILNG